MPWLAELLPFRGRQDNLALREAAMVALGFNVAMVALAALSVALTIPKGRSATA
jgi:DHA2 family multidrug resistance protein-like MFS transporter